MEIQNQNQYNQSISRYKLLSSTAGVGSIITTDTGNYVVVSDVGQWPFIKTSNNRIGSILEDRSGSEDPYEKIKKDLLENLGLNLVDDGRFIQFLRNDNPALGDLLCLAAIPQLSLNEHFNSLTTKNNPVIKKLKDMGIEKKPEDFTIPATHFPKWFRNEKGDLKTYKEWKDLWNKIVKLPYFFAPPRDPDHKYPGKKKFKDVAGNTLEEHKELTQLNIVLICANGHLSDIPWSKFLNWRTQLKRSGGDKKGTRLFTDTDNCCDKPMLKWTENRNRSEGYGSIFIECCNPQCRLGDGDMNANRPKISLEGINNLKPECPGHKPWQIDLSAESNMIPYDPQCSAAAGGRTTMQVALVTGNNVYFANPFSSIYIPVKLLRGIPEEVDRLLRICERKFDSLKDPNKERQDWARRRIDGELLDEHRVVTPDRTQFLEQLATAFVHGVEELQQSEDEDYHEFYKRQEYHVLTSQTSSDNEDLILNDITLPKALLSFFNKIQKVEELKVTSVQLDFTRVSPNERIINANGQVTTGNGQNIFADRPQPLYIMPAVENYGEGIFFDLNNQTIGNWLNTFEKQLIERIRPLLPTRGSFNGNALRNRIRRDRAKLLLIHTFSHLIMRELEFTCGYPTASLKERLYVSPEMSGFLIYTADGSEGSMGGLIWQAHPERMTQLIVKAMERAVDCSADPLCWEESDGQGVFNLNLSACFSCALVSETACEERNLALDRRILIDPIYGYFKELIA